jgi:hypothetical protein
MTHIKGKERRQRKVIRRMILTSSFRDRIKCETVCRLSRADILASLTCLVDVDVVPDVEVGEVLLDSRGEGSFQK